VATLALLSACATSGATSSGAAFNATVSTPRVGALELVAACWPDGASGSVTFSRAGDRDLRFEAAPPSLNPTARCQREVLLTAPDGLAAVGSGLTLSPPQGPLSGWVVLAWARLLNEGRYGPEKGLLDAAPLVRACLAQGMGLRGAPTFTVDPEGRPRVQVVSESGSVGAVTDTERCVEAVLGAAAWPNSRAQRFRLTGAVGAPAPQGDVAPWFGGAGPERPALDPAAVKESLAAHKAEIFTCWEQAIARRPELEGGRSVRLRAGPDGAVTQVTVVGNLTDARSMPGDYVFDQCVVGVVSRTRFPQGGESVYSWNFAL
jgi:hypothetical protein